MLALHPRAQIRASIYRDTESDSVSIKKKTNRADGFDCLGGARCLPSDSCFRTEPEESMPSEAVVFATRKRIKRREGRLLFFARLPPRLSVALRRLLVTTLVQKDRAKGIACVMLESKFDSLGPVKLIGAGQRRELSSIPRGPCP